MGKAVTVAEPVETEAKVEIQEEEAVVEPSKREVKEEKQDDTVKKPTKEEAKDEKKDEVLTTKDDKAETAAEPVEIEAEVEVKEEEEEEAVVEPPKKQRT